MGTVSSITSARSRRPAGTAPAAHESVAQGVAPGTRLYTTAELGRILRRTPRSIRRDVEQGCPRVPVGLSHHRFVLADVLAWHQNRREGSGGPNHQSCA